ncbi:MAG: hypothetical protein E4H17_01290 [Gemmatimonadales bacterium]|nr:MAG: hypothetical protein E4H17_01290 [Gemmatimonadales bacterium]
MVTRFLTSMLLLAALSSSAQAQTGVGYPRLGLYGTVGRTQFAGGSPGVSAYPFLDAQGNVVDSVAAWHAKFDVVVLEASETLERPDILRAIRRHNPTIKIIGFTDACQVWWLPMYYSVNYPDTLNCLRRKLWNAVVNTNGFLYSKRYGDYYNPNRSGRDPLWSASWYMVNLANQATVDSLVSILAQDVIGSGLYDGLFVDLISETMAWTAVVDSFDYERAGYPSAKAYEQAWQVGHRRYAAGLRAAAPPGFMITLNWAVPDEKAWVNGSIREEFPYQGGGTWQTNMMAVFEEERNYLQPPAQWLNTQCDPCSDALAANNRRKVRFGLGSATLCEAYHTISENDRPSRTQRWNWWYDEYAVDLATGRASRKREDTGWLGAARGTWYQMIWAGNGPDAATNPDFENSVTGGWGFWADASVAATVTQDTTTAAKGRASVRIHMPNMGVADWYVALRTAGTLTMQAGQSYSATFWAKASKPRRITVSAAMPGTSYVLSPLDVGTEWRQCQVILIPKVACVAQLHLCLAAADGDVWLDDVHFQEGVTNLYRRNFQNGIVLVNPAARSLSVTLETSFRKILGTADPVVNDGSWVSWVTVPSSDAVFLIGRDGVAPATPGDLRIIR